MLSRDPEFKRDCHHRKPAPGMLLSAARELGLRLPGCRMVGDKVSDVQAGTRAGCRAIRIGEPNTPDLLAAAHDILEPNTQRPTPNTR